MDDLSELATTEAFTSLEQFHVDGVLGGEGTVGLEKDGFVGGLQFGQLLQLGK